MAVVPAGAGGDGAGHGLFPRGGRDGPQRKCIQPIYSHAEGRWKRYKKQLSNIQPLLNKFITNY